MASPSLSALLREPLAALQRSIEGPAAPASERWLRCLDLAEALEADARTLADLAERIIAIARVLGGAVVSDDEIAAIERRRSREGGRG